LPHIDVYNLHLYPSYIPVALALLIPLRIPRCRRHLAVAIPPWLPHPDLDPEIALSVQRVIDRIPQRYLLPPIPKETFDEPDQA